MGDFIKNNPFRFWCQKVLPLVYDDSLSYYELLCKVVAKLNELAENQNNLSDEIKEVAKDLNDFKNQVPGMVEAKVEEWLNNYITTHGLVNSVNGMTGVVTLTAADVGAIANVNGSVKNNNIADGAVTAEKIADGAVTGDKIAGKAITANKLADGVIPEKLPNPQKLTFTGAVTGEYDGSQAVNIDIPAGGGGGGGGAVDSVNGMTGAVVLKKLTAGEGLSMSGADGYNGSAEQSVGIAPSGVSSDKIADGAVTANKMASGVIPTKLPNPNALTFTGGASGEYDGSEAVTVDIPQSYYVRIPETKDSNNIPWTGSFTSIGGKLGVLSLTARATPKTGNATWRYNVSTGMPLSVGYAAVVAAPVRDAIGEAEALINQSYISIQFNINNASVNARVTIPITKD